MADWASEYNKTMSLVDEYLATLEPPQQAELKRVKSLVTQLVPGVEEVIGYGIPTFKFKGKSFLHFAAYKDHLSLFPGPAPIKEFEKELAGYTLSKGTIQFTVEKPLARELLIKIIMSCRNRIEQV